MLPRFEMFLSLCLCTCMAAGTCNGEDCASDLDPASLVQRRFEQAQKRYKPRDIRGKSLYFIVVDNFGSPPAAQGDAACNSWEYGWCNGTINGITEQLDYIQGMGFEGIWITPVIKNFDGKDPDGDSGYGTNGYWAYDWYEIDEHFGTKKDLKKLSRELHKRGMVFVYDIVLNHCGPVHSTADVEQIVPFNKPEYFHQRGIGNMTFDAYAKGHAYGGKGYPPPVQGLGPGAMCVAGPDGGCSNYKCPEDPGFGKPCPVVPTYWGDLDPPQDAPGPRDIPLCGVGDMVCEGYNEDQTIEGWFYDLGDLNHSHPFVSSELIKWGKFMADTYEIDGFRLDTAPYIRQDFLANFQEAVGIPILGEVTASNWTFFKSYAPPTGSPVLKGLLNFYLQNVATPAFCGPPAFFPGADLNLSALAANIAVEFAAGQLYDVNLLGNFVDNHDTARLAFFCNKDMSRMLNAIAWTMFAQGLPIIFYGTELFFTEVHPSMWSTGYPTDTMGYKFLKALNLARKKIGCATTPMEVRASGENYLVFTRGDVWIFLNNFALGSFDTVDYHIDLPKPKRGHVWMDLISGNEVPDTRAAQLPPMALAQESSSRRRHRRRKFTA